MRKWVGAGYSLSSSSIVSITFKGLATSAYTDRLTDEAKFIQHVQELEPPAIHRLIELEVDCPDVVLNVGTQQLPAAVCWAAALAPGAEWASEPPTAVPS